MLSTPAPFPHVGAIAFLKPHGDRVRIVARDLTKADPTALIAFTDPAYMGKATGNIRVPLADLFETREAAFPAAKPRTRRRAPAKAGAA